MSFIWIFLTHRGWFWKKKVFPALKANCGRFPDASWRNLNIPFVEFKGPGKERKGVENPISLSHLSWACWLSKGYLLMDVVPIAQKNDEISFLSSIFCFLSNPFGFQDISRVTRSMNNAVYSTNEKIVRRTCFQNFTVKTRLWNTLFWNKTWNKTRFWNTCLRQAYLLHK